MGHVHRETSMYILRWLDALLYFVVVFFSPFLGRGTTFVTACLPVEGLTPSKKGVYSERKNLLHEEQILSLKS